MKEIDIINPCAGKGLPLTYQDPAREQYITSFPGDAEEHVKALCQKDPNILFHIYGGDGTVHEVINGIMAAGTADRTAVTIHPAGTGNDFYRMLAGDREQMLIDLICYRTKTADGWSAPRYSPNMINIGFDCEVAAGTAEMKKLPLVKGGLAYIFALVKVLLRKMGKHFDITFTAQDGSEKKVQKELLLTAIGNGGYCGGGFFAAPIASIDDGLLDILIVNKISRFTFIKLVGNYRKGTHIDPETGLPYEKFKDVLQYVQCTGIRIGGIGQICVDGQIEDTDEVDISIAPKVLTLKLAPQAAEIDAAEETAAIARV